jgi:hypothetical protein
VGSAKLTTEVGDAIFFIEVFFLASFGMQQFCTSSVCMKLGTRILLSESGPQFLGAFAYHVLYLVSGMFPLGM